MEDVFARRKQDGPRIPWSLITNTMLFNVSVITYFGCWLYILSYVCFVLMNIKDH